jgi:hypothetical protein
VCPKTVDEPIDVRDVEDEFYAFKVRVDLELARKAREEALEEEQ